METSQPRLVESGEVRIIGHRWSPHVHELKAFFDRCRVPYKWLAVDLEKGRESQDLAERVVPGVEKYPVVLFADGTALVDPDVRTVAKKLGLDTEPSERFYDLIVVGGGPAGLSAAINASSEGLRTVIVEQELPGGQASFSACIENYAGFTHGVSGSDLAKRTMEQAKRFGVEIIVTRKATQLRQENQYRHVLLDDGIELGAHAVLLAMGVSFRWLDAPGCPPLVGAGVYYGAATAEASAFRGQDIYILGGGNSAAQAALLLAQYARRVIILTLEDSLEETVSQYLVDRIGHTPNIEVRTNHTVVAAEGNGHLERITIKDVHTEETEQVSASGLFVFIGATPRTEWLEGTVLRDEQGFVLSGFDLSCDERLRPTWPLSREPYRMETSVPGVFVAGDVRRGSAKRLATAVGEGAMAVRFIHEYRKDGREAESPPLAAAGR